MTKVFSDTAGGLVGGMASTAGLVKDLVVAKAQAVGESPTFEASPNPEETEPTQPDSLLSIL
jgi:hypothetical protein